MSQMGKFSTIAGIASICALALGLFEAIAMADNLPAAVCLASFFLFGGVFLKTRPTGQHDSNTLRQNQYSGANSTNYQAGANIQIGGSESVAQDSLSQNAADRQN